MKKLLATLCTLLLGANFVCSANEASLRMEYTRMMEDLKSELTRAIPQVSEARKSAYFDALKKEAAVDQQLKEAQKQMAAINNARGLVGHAKNKWIAEADRGIAKAKAQLEKAQSRDERNEAKKALAHWEKNREAGVRSLKARTARWEKLKRDKPKIERSINHARDELAQAKTAVIEATKALGLETFLADDSLDGKLARYVALKEATPKALAEYAAQGREHEQRVDAMLASDGLLVQIALADGPRKAHRSPAPDYGRMLDILHDIHQASDNTSNGTLVRLALAVALEHAAPHGMRSAKADTDAPRYVDPLKRYMHFEKAFLNDELDPHFKNLTVWDMRMVVNGEEPEEILAWGREMLRNYRPDHITTTDHRWRYVGLVRTDIRYGSQDNKYDKDELQFFQNILMNGGVCGRRAFIGRFILRAFGSPTTARPQTGHAALVHWTPDGWVPVLGGGWGSGWTKTRYRADRDFLATTQARALGEHYLKVKRAHWVGDLMNEPRIWGLLNKKQPEFWNGVALYTQSALIADKEALGAVGEELGEANFSEVVYATDTAEVTDEDRKVSVDGRGVITIPAAATSEPKSSRGGVLFMPSVLGGKQLHFKRGGKGDFEYKLEAQEAGYYALVAKVATPSWKQNLILSLNGEDNAAKIPLPHTVGMWDYTQPVQIELKRGMNTLRFSHTTDGHAKGFTIKEFQLAPVPEHARNQ